MWSEPGDVWRHPLEGRAPGHEPMRVIAVAVAADGEVLTMSDHMDWTAEELRRCGWASDQYQRRCSDESGLGIIASIVHRLSDDDLRACQRIISAMKAEGLVVVRREWAEVVAAKGAADV